MTCAHGGPGELYRLLQLAISTFTVSFCSSCYSGGLASMRAELHMSEVLAILGVSLYVLGFGLGPLVFAPLGELYGRVSTFYAARAFGTHDNPAAYCLCGHRFDIHHVPSGRCPGPRCSHYSR